MVRKLHVVLGLSLAFAGAGFMAGCGDDEKKSDKADTTAAAQTHGEETTPAEEPTVEMDEATLREFIDAVNEDPAILCDPDNATAELLQSIGGEEACKEAAATETPGEEYEIKDLTIEGDSATAVIVDKDSTTTVTFVTEGDQIKIASTE